MDAFIYEELDHVIPCKYCGNIPKLLIKWHERGDKSQEITCCGDEAICLFDSYIEVTNDLDAAIKEWNEKNI